MIAQKIERIKQSLLDQGRTEGRTEGFSDGRRNERIAMLSRLLQLKHGRQSEEIEARLETASMDQLANWSDKVLVSSCLEDVFED